MRPRDAGRTEMNEIRRPAQAFAQCGGHANAGEHFPLLKQRRGREGKRRGIPGTEAGEAHTGKHRAANRNNKEKPPLTHREQKPRRATDFSMMLAQRSSNRKRRQKRQKAAKGGKREPRAVPDHQLLARTRMARTAMRGHAGI